MDQATQQNAAMVEETSAAGTTLADEASRGLSQIFELNRMLTIGVEFAAPKLAERVHDSEFYFREAEAPIKG